MPKSVHPQFYCFFQKQICSEAITLKTPIFLRGQSDKKEYSWRSCFANKYGKDNYLDFHEEARAYNQGVLDAIDALIRLQDILPVSENEKSFDLVIYSGGIYSFKEFKKMTSLVKEEMKQRKFKVKYVRPSWTCPHSAGKYIPFALRIYGW